ncbi:MAG: hypothetical protein ACI91F_003228 [Candidatus Binatia bacterium]|jgi:hypothetical protein
MSEGNVGGCSACRQLVRSHAKLWGKWAAANEGGDSSAFGLLLKISEALELVLLLARHLEFLGVAPLSQA